MEIVINESTIQIILLVFGIIMTVVTARYSYYYGKLKLAITESRVLLEILEEILSDDKITSDELKTKLLPAFNRLRKLYG